ncbi:hypothetical protein QBC35DRAFT_506355 [Podospora australis]|uniref:Uncharacterized protein n=1 Tax=Podospora australis TaxID=1536484 RepID=A0AAN7AEH8_9PEZI|nr:hypothetical protein QBC35DRAFT_506355 [Podospora australis]
MTEDNRQEMEVGTNPVPSTSTGGERDPIVLPRRAPTFKDKVLRVGEGCVRCRMLRKSRNTNHVSTHDTESAGANHSLAPKGAVGYVVIGFRSELYGHRVERLFYFSEQDKKHLFRKLRWEILCLTYTLSSIWAFVTGFRLYRCNPTTGEHRQLTLDSSVKDDLRDLAALYITSWVRKIPLEANEKWADWIIECLNGGSVDIGNEDAFSLELVTGLSMPKVVSFLMFPPLVLSLSIGLWINSGNWHDTATIQVAWGVASYIITAGALFAAFMAIGGAISSKKHDEFQ